MNIAAGSAYGFANVVTDDGSMDIVELESAEFELASLPGKREAVVRGGTLSPSRRTLMVNRVAALKVALNLVDGAKSQRAT